MRIVFDGRSIFPGMGGIGRHALNLARELAKHLGDEEELIVLVGSRRLPSPTVSGPRTREHTVDAALIDPEFEQIRLPALLEELEADLYHNPCFSVPIAASGVRRVATVHDVVFLRLPDLVEPRLRRYLTHATKTACAAADRIITASEFSRREIEELCDRPADSVVVVPNAVDPSFFEPVQPRRMSDVPYVLYVGSLETKKNVSALVHGFARLLEDRPELPHRLLLAGGRGGGPCDLGAALAREPRARDRVTVLDHVPEPSLRPLIQGASVFAYLSEYEGFGLPPLEAMACGVPTLVSDRSALPEVTNGASMLVDPHDPAAVARALDRLIGDEALRRELVSRGRIAARRFSWAKSAEQLLELYRDLVRPRLRVLEGGVS